MLRKALMTVICASAIASALPTIKITTPDGQNPPNGRQVAGSSSMAPSYDFDYVCMSRFEISGADTDQYNFVRNTPGDSVRLRGNSSAGSSHTKKPYRIKLDQKVSLLGREAAKNWVLLANNVDNTMARNATAFRLAEIMGLPYTPTFDYVNVEICAPNGGQCSYKGVYMLTEQVEVNRGRVDIDKDFGWLVEINFHGPDANDIMFTTSAFNMTAFVKSPDVKDEDYRGSDISLYPELTFVRDEFSGILNAMNNSSQFNSGEYRGMIDITSYAKYTLLNQFMSNPEWGGNMGNMGGSGNGMPGSNFAHKDVNGKMTAGPTWDFDHAGSSMGGGSSSIETGISFYRKFFDDEVFRARYRKAWDVYKEAVADITRSGGLLDSIASVLEPHIVANYNASRSSGGGGGGMGGSAPATADAHRSNISSWKTWLNNRVTTFNNAITTGNGVTRYDASKDQPDPPYSGPIIGDPGDNPGQGGTQTIACNGYTLTVNVGEGGTVSLSCNGNSATATPATNQGYLFLDWTGGGLSGGATSSTDNPITLQMTRDRTITANFGQPSPIMFAGARTSSARTRATLRPSASGFTALLPTGHGYTSYRLIDLRGREIRRGTIGAGMNDLRIDNVRAGVVFLKLDGKNGSATLTTTTVR